MSSTAYQNLLAYDHAISSALEDQNTLVEISTVLAKNVKTGLDPAAAKLTHICIESIAARLGLKETRVVPCLESFDNKYGKAMATQIALEGVNDFIRNVFKMIANAFKSLLKFLQEFWDEVFNKSNLAETRDKWKEFIKEVRNKTTTTEVSNEEKFIENGSLATKLFLDKEASFVSAMKMGINAEQTADVLKAYIKPLETTSNEILKKFEAIKNELKNGNQDVDSLINMTADSYEIIETNIESFFKDKLKKADSNIIKKLNINSDNSDVYVTEPLVAGNVIIISQNKTKDNAAVVPTVSLSNNSITSGVSVSNKLKALDVNKGELLKLAEQTQKISVDAIIELGQYSSTFNNINKKFAKMCEDLANLNFSQNYNDPKVAAQIKAVANDISVLSKFMQNHAIKFFVIGSMQVKLTGQALREYVLASAKAHALAINL